MFTAKSREPAKAKAEGAPGRPKPKTEPGDRAQANPLWDKLATHVQAKLAVSGPGDPYEREADRVADQVMGMADRPSRNDKLSLSSVRPSMAQRKCAACDEEQKEKLRRKENGSVADAPATISPIVDEALSAPGQPLDAATRGFFEPRLGADLGAVRVHTDVQADAAARAIHARAFTFGGNVVFGQGQYRPQSDGGRRLLAHELTHTIQQGSKPLVAAGGLMMSQPGDPGEREADTAAAAVMRAPRTAARASGIPAICLSPTGPFLARKPAPKPAPPPCTMSCTDPAFLALSPSAREAELNTQCPQGFPASGNTFFGQPIPAVSKTLSTKLLDAQARAKRAMCLGGQDPNAFVLTRSIITYAKHSPAMDKAVDIDVKGQPYIMHEKGEPEIDKETGPVYDRIAFWSLFRKSVIPKGITSVSRAPKTSTTDRTWTDPETGTKNVATTTGELYDKLKAESDGMQGYFNLLLKSDQELASAIFAFNAVNTDGTTDLAKLKIPADDSNASVTAFRQQIANDYRVLGGSRAQLEAFAGKPIAAASKAPPSHLGDRPFEGGVPAGSTLPGGAPDPAQNRRPELGFISLPREVVVALTEVGLVWGAVDFGGASGDVMHFDCRNIPNC